MKKGTTFQEVNASIVLIFSSSQFILYKHLVEQHNNFQKDNNCLIGTDEQNRLLFTNTNTNKIQQPKSAIPIQSQYQYNTS
jgi:hypothetical protein